MNLNELAAKSMAATALILVASASGRADGFHQTPNWSLLTAVDFSPYSTTPTASLLGSTFRAAPLSQQDTWHTVMVVSAVVGVAGLISGSDALLVLGGAGVLLSVAETGGSNLRYQSFHHGFDLLHTGPLYFGVGSFGFGQGRGAASTRTGPYVQLAYKF